MGKHRSFELFENLLAGYAGIFMHLVIAVIVVYLVVMIINFLRDKFIHKEVSPKKEDILDLLVVLYYLFFVSGIGFAVGNLIQVLLHRLIEMENQTNYYINGEWDYLILGILFLSIGLSFKMAVKKLKSERKD